MARRSRAREVALQLLFQQDVNAKPVRRSAIEKFAQDRLREPELVAFALSLFDGVLAHRAAIDECIVKTAENWRLNRINPSDRNVLRLAIYELCHNPNPEPKSAVLNEAIELARRFGSEDSPSFVNGILDNVANAPIPAAPAA
jgi:N utilization substance protein B